MDGPAIKAIDWPDLSCHLRYMHSSMPDVMRLRSVSDVISLCPFKKRSARMTQWHDPKLKPKKCIYDYACEATTDMYDLFPNSEAQGTVF